MGRESPGVHHKKKKEKVGGKLGGEGAIGRNLYRLGKNLKKRRNDE